MNLFDIFSKIEQLDPEAGDRLSFYNRRHLLQHGAKAAALAAIPTFFSSVVNKAFGQTSQGVDVLKFALTLEYLEADFYTQGVAKGTALINGDHLKIFTQIRDHENAHVALLEGALKIAPNSAKPVITYQAFADVFTNYQTFLAVSQSFEDLGVRAYKGQAGNLTNEADLPYLQTALQIHSVEARHAAIVRKIRGQKGWIPLNEPNAPVAAVYAGEANITQGGVKLTDLGTGQNESQLSEGFDEPLAKADVIALAKIFIPSL